MCFKYSVCNQEVGRELGICSLRHSQQEFQLAFTSVCGFYNNQRLAFVIVGDLFSVTGINRIRMRKLHRTFLTYILILIIFHQELREQLEKLEAEVKDMRKGSQEALSPVSRSRAMSAISWRGTRI